MAVGVSNRAQLTYITETVWGTTPGAGSMQIMRYTGESIDNQFNFTESAEIIADRMTTDIIRVGAQAGGDVNIELSYGAYDVWLEAALQGTWTSDILKTGTTARSFTLEKQFLDLTQFHAFPGQRVDSFRLDLRTGQVASGSFGFLGKQGNAMAGTTVRAGTTAAATEPVLAPVNDLSVINEGGSSLVGAQELTLSLSNSMRPLPVINSADLLDVNSGRQRLTGTLLVYFQDAALFAKFRALTNSAISATIGAATLKKYTILIPKVKYTKATIVAGGGDQDMMVALEWTAIKDTTENSLIKITRAVV